MCIRDRARSVLQEQAITRLQNYSLSLFQLILSQPYAYGALRMLSGQERGGPIEQVLAPLGFEAPVAGRPVEDISGLFQGMIPSLGALSQADPEALQFLAPLLGYMGISPAEFAREAAAVTPMPGGGVQNLQRRIATSADMTRSPMGVPQLYGREV